MNVGTLPVVVRVILVLLAIPFVIVAMAWWVAVFAYVIFMAWPS